jgi:hypothetical protein
MRENSSMNFILELIQTQLFQCHRQERRRFLRFARNRLPISYSECHCEERSDAAISSYKNEIATLPSVARNDIVKIDMAVILDWQKLSNYTEFNKRK